MAYWCPQCQSSWGGSSVDGFVGNKECHTCQLDKATALLFEKDARIAELEALLSPGGAIRERVQRLIEVAKRMGFERADEAAWNQDADPEYSAVESIEIDVEYYGCGKVYSYDIGLYLHETVYAFQDYDEDADEYLVVVLDDKAEAEKRVARKDGA